MIILTFSLLLCSRIVFHRRLVYAVALSGVSPSVVLYLRRISIVGQFCHQQAMVKTNVATNGQLAFSRCVFLTVYPYVGGPRFERRLLVSRKPLASDKPECNSVVRSTDGH